MGAVHPDLVGAPRVELEAQQGVIPQPLHQLPVGAGMAAALTDHRIFLAIAGVAANGTNHRALVGLGHPMDHRQVLAGSDALLDLHLQLHQGFLAFGHHDAAGGVLIEAMDDAGAHLPTDAGQIGAVVQQRIHQGAVLVAGGRVHREAGGLVEHDQMPVFKQHIQGDVLGQQIGKGLGRGHPKLHLIARAQGGLGAAHHPIHPHVAGIDELLNAGPALLRPLGHQPAIEPHRQGLGVVEGQQLPLAFTKRRHDVAASSGLAGAGAGARTGAGVVGNSRAMAPSAERR